MSDDEETLSCDFDPCCSIYPGLVELLDAERARNEKLVAALEHLASEKTDSPGAYKMRALKTARKALAENKGDE